MTNNIESLRSVLFYMNQYLKIEPEEIQFDQGPFGR